MDEDLERSDYIIPRNLSTLS